MFGMMGRRVLPRRDGGKREETSSRQTVGTGAEEFEEAEVAEDLELLANFVADVGVLGMELGKGVCVRVDIGESEFEFA
jgi:hypothetical protein